MDSSPPVDTGVSAVKEVVDDDIPLSDLCYDEDCTLLYLHPKHDIKKYVNTDTKLVRVLKVLGFGFLGLNFLLCFWLYLFIFVMRVLHLFHIDPAIHLPFHIPFAG